ncbi:DUF805 domain-containing protein [Endozoicomonas sp. SM1973]|uniref:DUF805 domain-containing protein n=1 Tax=Spartinivicinus marinus TaxID=2994442 RepID=A0A853IHT0_9GAMM|nr:DUF805 domain-containing protein [Spartinivicinus marinus]MCX4028590.1 DUF805 domain-containing protein [Spartinivicinus marinus]NYZ67146.1 DUF805 domain-containing protein [Spartinivicinus marinus]
MTVAVQNSYLSPQTNTLKESSNERSTPTFFGVKGRINRLRFFIYNLGFSLLSSIVAIPIFMMAGVFIATSNSESAMGANLILMVILYGLFTIGGLAYFMTTCIRRCHDLGKTGWLTLLIFVPILNLFFYLYMLFAKGEDDTNQWCNAPIPCPTWHQLIAGIFIGLFLLAFVGGIVGSILN